MKLKCNIFSLSFLFLLLVRCRTNMSANYFWSSTTSHNHPKLLPHHHTTLSLEACFLHPGIFDVNRFHFNARNLVEDDAEKREWRVLAENGDQFLITIISEEE